MSKPGNPPFHVLIPAAGNGSRMGTTTPKQYCKVGGKMILRYTIEKFLPIQGLKSIRVIIDPAHKELYEEAVAGLDLPPPINGAATRKQSVYNGLQSFNHDELHDLVLIHDAARPFIAPEAVESLLQEMNKCDAATLAAPVTDTIVDQDQNVLDRDTLSVIKTPQGFKIELLKHAHETFRNDDRFTDDSGLISALGKSVKLVQGNRDNFKITTAEDMILAEKLLAPALETRMGSGFDVHAFDPTPADKIRIGGIDIPHERKLLGHSDADVVLHALTDALLGAISEGDIGTLFPPSEAQWKNADSEIFLKEAVNRVVARGGRILHADITIMCEAPKIGPHREAMQKRISEIVGVAQNRISIKATTTEGLGFTGRREGIASQVVCTITLPASEE
jgi:2-C-methyl-D-erythritol 4-phosphate cytidylyltransferase/2-C-methyl-D-erythritol 2,4-cyclodiphosphate synthase